jgi:hypothetical protein
MNKCQAPPIDWRISEARKSPLRSGFPPAVPHETHEQPTEASPVAAANAGVPGDGTLQRSGARLDADLLFRGPLRRQPTIPIPQYVMGDDAPYSYTIYLIHYVIIRSTTIFRRSLQNHTCFSRPRSWSRSPMPRPSNGSSNLTSRSSDVSSGRSWPKARCRSPISYWSNTMFRRESQPPLVFLHY